MEPTVGRIVLYRVKLDDLERLAPQIGGKVYKPADGEAGVPELRGPLNTISVGDEFPAVVVRPWHTPGQYAQGSSCLNAQALLDGPHSLWVLSAHEGTEPGTWRWPPRA
jgi:hypothetical protein